MISYGRQSISEADIEAVVEVLRSDYLTQGPVVPVFEAAVADMCQADSAVAVNSATSALHIACLALGIGPGDTVWTVPNTFVASANCALFCGANVDFVDIDSETWCLSVSQLEEKLQRHQQKGLSLPKVVIPVHFAGQSCDMEPIARLAEIYGFRIIEDASHAIGGSYRGEPVGSCRYSDISVFSFHPVKIITTGEGGIALTNRPDLYRRMRSLRTHGITRNPAQFTRQLEGPWHYEQLELGFNFRMTDLQGALGLSQLSNLPVFVDGRNRLADTYSRKLRTQTIRLQFIPETVRSARHLYVIRVPSQKRKHFFECLREENIGVNVHYLPVHLQPYYRNLGFSENQFPESEAHGKEAISLPLYPGLKESDQLKVLLVLERLSSEI